MVQGIHTKIQRDRSIFVKNKKLGADPAPLKGGRVKVFRGKIKEKRSIDIEEIGTLGGFHHLSGNWVERGVRKNGEKALGESSKEPLYQE